MKRLLMFAAALAGLPGCGPDKVDVATSELNELADTWDGGPKFTATGTDPWGQPYSAKVEKGFADYTLTVRSSGPDRLPKSLDDIIVRRTHKHTPLSEAAAPAVEKVGEAIGKGLGRGGAAGIREGITGKKADGKEADEKNKKAREDWGGDRKDDKNE